MRSFPSVPERESDRGDPMITAMDRSSSILSSTLEEEFHVFNTRMSEVE
jgi:hypothetical protein